MANVEFISSLGPNYEADQARRLNNLLRVINAEKEYEANRNKMLANISESGSLTLPEDSIEYVTASDNTNTNSSSSGWFTALSSTSEPVQSSTTTNTDQSQSQSTVTTKKHGTRADRDAVQAAIKDALEMRGVTDLNTVDALTILAGAESGYNYQALNPTSSAYGLGQWIKANHDKVVSYINQTHGTSYSNISDLGLEDQAEALVHWYYDKHKSELDSQNNTFDKVKYLAKVGLGPAILTGSYTNKSGRTYKNTDEDWLAYFHDTGHDKKNEFTTFDDHIKRRYKIAGYELA